jgi:hypothetical protein
MKLSKREWILAISTITVALYSLLFYVGSGWLSTLQVLRLQQTTLREGIGESKLLVADREQWEAGMEERRGLMPVFPHGQRMDLHWLSAIEGVASRHQLLILSHQSGEERQEGPVYELPVLVRQWEGSIDALVHFLFDIEREGAMLDVRYIHIRPKDRTVLQGRMDIFCAYRRDP